MGRSALSFKHTDVVRAVRAVQATGLDVLRTEIAPDGRITIVHRESSGAKDREETYEEWKARTGAGSS